MKRTAQLAHIRQLCCIGLSGQALMPALLPLYETLDPETYGGAILLGVDGVCIISHGSSTAKAMVNAIKVAQEMVQHGMVDEIRAAIAANA